MIHENFILDGNLLDQLQQPVLFAQENRFVHGNKQASEILALGGENLEDYFHGEQLTALEELTPGQSTQLPMICGGTRYQATITKEADKTVFLLKSMEENALSIGVLPSVAAAIRKPLVDVFDSMEQLMSTLEEMENEEYQAMTARMRRGMYRLFHLSANMFDYPMYVHKNRPLNFEKVKLDDFLYDKIEEIESLCEACNVQLTSDLQLRQYNGYLDKQQAYRLMLNLISNAIAATSPGGTIALKFEARGQILKIKVEDKGTGMEPSLISTMFQQFENGELHQKGGTSAGFGLPMAWQIAVTHGGTLVVNTAPGQGTTVLATLKLDKKNEDTSTHQTKVDYAGGHEVWAIELAELLPDRDYDSRAL